LKAEHEILKLKLFKILKKRTIKQNNKENRKKKKKRRLT
jgi:hypothetical protein